MVKRRSPTPSFVGRNPTDSHSIPHQTISTHAPLAGSDAGVRHHAAGRGRFNSRSPCGERRFPISLFHLPDGFNSRSPCGERRDALGQLADVVQFQLTLPLRGATPYTVDGQEPTPVSTHAPLAGSDTATIWTKPNAYGFNSRSPCGERRTAERGDA